MSSCPSCDILLLPVVANNGLSQGQTHSSVKGKLSALLPESTSSLSPAPSLVEKRVHLPYLQSHHLSTAESESHRPLVRWRCVVQDTTIPTQYCPSAIPIRHPESGECRWISTDYMDCPPAPWTIEMASQATAPVGVRQEFKERRAYVATCLPGQREWATPIASNQFSRSAASLLPVEPLRLLLKMHGSSHPEFKLNQMLDVVGVLERVRVEDSIDSSSSATPPVNSADFMEANYARLHVLEYELISPQEAHPFSDRSLTSSHLNAVAATATLTDVEPPHGVRTKLLEQATRALKGDSLAAEYLLCHIFSVTSRRGLDQGGGLASGAFPLNLVNCPSLAEDASFAENVQALLTYVLPRCANVALSIPSLNELQFGPAILELPSGTEECEFLPGQLLLPAGTHLLVDETTMDKGVLQQKGIDNLLTLSRVISDGCLPVKLPYREDLEVPAHVSVLVTSIGRSMLPMEVVVPLTPYFASTRSAVDENEWHEVRKYVGRGTFMPFNIPEDMRERIEKEFTAQRSADREAGRPLTSPEQLSQQLEVAKLLCKSYGLQHLIPAVWERAVWLEKERCARVDALPKRKDATSSLVNGISSLSMGDVVNGATPAPMDAPVR